MIESTIVNDQPLLRLLKDLPNHEPADELYGSPYEIHDQLKAAHRASERGDIQSLKEIVRDMFLIETSARADALKKEDKEAQIARFVEITGLSDIEAASSLGIKLSPDETSILINKNYYIEEQGTIEEALISEPVRDLLAINERKVLYETFLNSLSQNELRSFFNDLKELTNQGVDIPSAWTMSSDGGRIVKGFMLSSNIPFFNPEDFPIKREEIQLNNNFDELDDDDNVIEVQHRNALDAPVGNIPEKKEIKVEKRNTNSPWPTIAMASALFSTFGGVMTLNASEIEFSDEYCVNFPSNVRNGPGTENAIIGGYVAGTVIDTTGPDQDGWFPVNHNGQPGWISKGLVTRGNCETGTSQPQNTIQEVGGMTFINTPAEIDPNQIVQLWNVINGFNTNSYMDTDCNVPFVIFFGNSNEVSPFMDGAHVRGGFRFGVQNGGSISRPPENLSCTSNDGSLRRIIGIDLDNNNSLESIIEALIHELAHGDGAYHGDVCMNLGIPLSERNTPPTLDACYYQRAAVRAFQNACLVDDQVCVQMRPIFHP